MLKLIKDKMVPKLESCLHKGQLGRIGVIGGSYEYTGAPYFAAIAALRTGADLCHVFCTTGAASVIKSYSPELIVHPDIPTSVVSDQLRQRDESIVISEAVARITRVFERLDVLIIGPGLGRDNVTMETVSALIIKARDLQIPLVVDADGLYLISKTPDLVKDYVHCILTPNVSELKRFQTPNPNWTRQQIVEHLSKELGVTILSKGETDLIAHSRGPFVEVDAAGSPRRCGGQGDLLCGSIATFLAWGIKSNVENPTSFAAFAGANLVRHASVDAFKVHGRSMLASDIISFLPATFAKLYEQ